MDSGTLWQQVDGYQNLVKQGNSFISTEDF